MLCCYAVNQPGPSHLEQGVPCQDSYALFQQGDAIVVAVADGLGSERHSDVAAQMATAQAVSLFRDHMTPGAPLEVKKLLREAFVTAYDSVMAIAGDHPDQYDCTLTMAYYQGQTLWWGHSGDSGIVAALGDGSYVKVTEMQRDRDGRVFPLCFDDHWEFGQVEDVASFLLCTDGILEHIAPTILAVHGDNPVDTLFTRPFLHPQTGDAENLTQLQQDAQEFFATYPKERLDDDKTIVVVFDSEHGPGEREEAYYQGPDWDAVTAKAKTCLYGL